jgi:hypothetical protein
MPIRVYAVEKPELPPFEMPARFKHDITYFVTQAGEQGVPETIAQSGGKMLNVCTTTASFELSHRSTVPTRWKSKLPKSRKRGSNG